MAIKKWFIASLASLALLPCLKSYADFPGQTIQINTHLRSIQGKPWPMWLIVLHDIDNGQVLPYLFEVREQKNYWIALSLAHNYKIAASRLQLDSSHEIANFCNIEGRALIRQSAIVNVSGDLTADATTSECHTQYYKDFPIPIAAQSD